MPLYEFHCAACGKNSEILCKFSEADARPCDCGGTLDRTIGRIGFGAMDYGYQPGIVMESGERIHGHFGKSAPKKRRWL
jgi:putative FmdB family regulatory protein